jgi:hypothetical protein
MPTLSRELRPVPMDWKHPKDDRDRYVPLFSRASLRYDLAYQEALCDAGRADEVEPVSEQDYMPPIPEGTQLGWQLYEVTTEGTPESPVFARLEELAEWCENGTTVWAGLRCSAAEWLDELNAQAARLAQSIRISLDD